MDPFIWWSTVVDIQRGRVQPLPTGRRRRAYTAVSFFSFSICERVRSDGKTALRPLYYSRTALDSCHNSLWDRSRSVMLGCWFQSLRLLKTTVNTLQLILT